MKHFRCCANWGEYCQCSWHECCSFFLSTTFTVTMSSSSKQLFLKTFHKIEKTIQIWLFFAWHYLSQFFLQFSWQLFRITPTTRFLKPVIIHSKSWHFYLHFDLCSTRFSCKNRGSISDQVYVLKKNIIQIGSIVVVQRTGFTLLIWPA